MDSQISISELGDSLRDSQRLKAVRSQQEKDQSLAQVWVDLYEQIDQENRERARTLSESDADRSFKELAMMAKSKLNSKP